MLVPTQISMIAGITAVFGLDVNKSFITAVISATLGSSGATVLGRTVVSNILKLVPGVGSVAGGAISAGTAAIITTALGEAYIALMMAMCKGDISKDFIATNEGRKYISDMFTFNLKNAKNIKS